MSEVLELFGASVTSEDPVNWAGLVADQTCPFTSRKCFKIRKSQPDVSIGTCTVSYGKEADPVLICPNRLLERRQIFLDSIHLLSLHEPGNELHVVPEISIPGGSVDYFLVSARASKVRDFVGIELQTLDTTGTVWPARQRLLDYLHLPVDPADVASDKGFGMNWKMTAKTTLVQLHHKVETFEHFSKHLVLVIQDRLLDYLKREFRFAHVGEASVGNSMHFHSYRLVAGPKGTRRLELASRLSTDAAGISECLGLQAEAKLELDAILKQLESKLSKDTLVVL